MRSSIGAVYEESNRILRSLIWISISLSMLFYSVAFSTTILAPNVPLWPFYLHQLQNMEPSDTMCLVTTVALFEAGAVLLILKGSSENALIRLTGAVDRPNLAKEHSQYPPTQ